MFLNSSRLAIFFGIFLLALSAVAQRKEPERSSARLYATICAACHGPDMRGAQFKGFIPENWVGGSDDASLANAIRNGNPAKGMPPMSAQLSEAEIRAMVVYLRETIQQAKYKSSNFAKPVDGQVINSKEEKFQFKTVVGAGLDTPWAMAFLPDGRMLVTERSGGLRVVENGKLLPAPVTGTPKVRAQGQGGLLDVAVHPGYITNGWIYLSFSDPATNTSGALVGMTAVVRGRIKNNQWVDEQTIFRAPVETYLPTTLHYGSRLVFDGKGHLFFTIGERGRGDNAQNLKLPNGKVHRLMEDGRIPADNPCVNEPGAVPSIWSHGHRNPQGLAQHPVTGELWEAEHGPRGGDELNWIQPGKNYGWPIICYGMEYNGTPVGAGLTAKEGLEQPATYWTPVIAVCGIGFYTGDKFPKWKNDLFVTGLASQELRRLVLNGHKVAEQEVIFKGIGRLRSVITGPDGFLYVALNSPDRIVRLEPAK